MPPRRPGGKYKGLVGRAKGEATLAAEAAEKAKKAQEAALKKIQAQREREALLSHGVRSSEEQEKEAHMRKVMNMMMGGKKQIREKFFRSWVAGLMMAKKDRMVQDREAAWRRSCAHGHPGQCAAGCSCSTHCQLVDSVHELPTDKFLKTGVMTASGFFGAAPPLPALPWFQGPGSSAGDQRRRGTLAIQDGRTLADGRRGSSAALLGSRPASRGMQANDTQMGRARSAAELPPVEPWLQAGQCDVVAHHATGRRCFLDKSTMRMEFSTAPLPKTSYAY